jgi:hypothetical protein
MNQFRAYRKSSLDAAVEEVLPMASSPLFETTVSFIAFLDAQRGLPPRSVFHSIIVNFVRDDFEITQILTLLSPGPVCPSSISNSGVL